MQCELRDIYNTGCVRGSFRKDGIICWYIRKT